MSEETYPSNTLLERSAIPVSGSAIKPEEQKSEAPKAVVNPPPKDIPGKKKKGLLNTLCETFFEVDAKTAGQEVAKKVIIPSIQDTLLDATEGFLNTWFHGLGTDVARRMRGLNVPRYSGDPYWTGVSVPPSQPPQPTVAKQSKVKRFRRVNEMVEGLWWPGQQGYSAAKAVCDAMLDWVNRYESVTVYDLWKFAGEEVDWAVHSYGWMKEDGDLQTKMQIIAEAGGYRLIVPPPTNID